MVEKQVEKKRENEMETTSWGLGFRAKDLELGLECRASLGCTGLRGILDLDSSDLVDMACASHAKGWS